MSNMGITDKGQFEGLTDYQKKWAWEQVRKFERMRVGGMKVAIPFGLIYDQAEKITEPKNN